MANDMKIWAGAENPAASTPLRPPDEPKQDDSSSGGVIVINRNTLYMALAFGLVIGAYIFGWAMGSASSTGTSQVVREAVATALADLPANQQSNAVVAQPQQLPTEDQSLRFAVDTVGNPSLGPDNALVTLVEFSDFQCPFCGQFYSQVEKPLLKKYEGKIRLVYHDFPLRQIHPYAQAAAEAAQCANEQGKFWEYHDALFQNQPQFEMADLLNYAGQLKLDKTTFQACVESGKYTQYVNNNYQAGALLGISGTPTFFINGRKLVGAQPLSAFSAYIDAELAVKSTSAISTAKP